MFFASLADLSSNPTTVCKLQPPHRDEQRKSSRFSIASFGETTEGDPFNLVPYIDQVGVSRLNISFTFQN